MMAMENVAKKQVISLTCYVIALCRKFKLFPSERTTILTHNEEMQILQYCSAFHNKKVSSNFNANPRLCEKIHSQMNNKRIVKLEADVLSKVCTNKDQNSETSSIEQQENDNNGDKKDIYDDVEEKIECSLNEKQPVEIDEDDAVMSLFLKSLESSNHLTLLDVFEKFLGEVLNNESKMYTFVVVDFKTKRDTRPCENSSLPKVEALTLKVLRSIAGIENIEKDESTSSQTLTSSQGTPIIQNDDDLNESLHVMSQLSSPSTSRVINMSQRLKAVKTPVQVFKSKYQLSSPLPATPITPSTDMERQQVQKKYIENILRCYIHLLVNTRCELALAYVFNIPDRELNHEAFTHLKHASAASGLSMYQTMSSILMRVRLGGHGYAPPSDSPLMTYIKGLGCLFDFVDKLQIVIEESVSPRAGCKKVINILKRSITACKSRRFPSTVVESVANALWDVLDDILSEMEKESKEDKSEDSASQDGVVMGQESIDAFQKYLDQSSTNVSDVDRFLLGDVRFSQDTPTRLPCFMNQFRSPLFNVDEEEDLDGNSPITKSEIIRPPVTKVSEALYLDNEEADKVVCTPLDFDNVYVIPSKTIVHPKCGADYGETSEVLFSPGKQITTKQKVQKKRGPYKRKKKADVEGGEKQDFDENSPRPKSIKNCDGKSNKTVPAVREVNAKNGGCDMNKKQSKSCRRKLLPQVKGQSKITGFFKV